MEENRRTRLTPVETLDRLFEEIREQARNDAGFADRLIRALDVDVIYEGEDALKASDPVHLAGFKEREAFVAIYNVPAFGVAAIKKLMLNAKIATKEDWGTRRNKKQLIEFMYERASDKAHERSAW